MDQDTDKLIRETVEQVENYWNAHKKPLLLSALGSLDGGRISKYARLHSGGLRAFLENFTPTSLLLVQHSQNKVIVGVAPVTDDTQKIVDWDPLLEKTSSNPSQPRLHPAFWAAFRKPLTDSLKRYLQLTDPLEFHDLPSRDAPDNGLHIGRDYIASPDADADEIYRNAVRWIKANEMNISDFLHRPSSIGDKRLPSNDLLGRLILSLNSQDLQRTSIPMDVVAKLRRQPV